MFSLAFGNATSESFPWNLPTWHPLRSRNTMIWRLRMTTSAKGLDEGSQRSGSTFKQALKSWKKLKSLDKQNSKLNSICFLFQKYIALGACCRMYASVYTSLVLHKGLIWGIGIGTVEQRSKTLMTFHYTDWFLGIPLLAYYNPYTTG